MTYENEKKFGAVLLTSRPATESAIKTDVSRLVTWGERNMGPILKWNPDVEHHGMWIVTRTYGTSKISLNAWKSQGTAKMAFFTVDPDKGDLAPTDFCVGTGDGWSNYEAKVRMFLDGGKL
jgi:hypothetical protein